MRRPRYDDGLDDDGSPAEREPYRKPYVRGSEADAGDFKPVQLGVAWIDGVTRLSAANAIGSSADSPIELQLGAAIVLFFSRANQPLKLCLEVPEGKPDELLLVPQFRWHFYRSDWAIFNPSRDGALLIECDGKDFHSSPQQRLHDSNKDAAALDRGFLTMRFPGSLIFRDPDGCAQKVYDAVCGGEQ